MEIIKLTNLEKIYGKKESEITALKNFNLSVESKDMLAVMGPSGCGKSTLLNILGCTDMPTKGEYILKGRAVNTLSSKELAKIRNKDISFVFQNFALIKDYSVLENIELPLIYRNRLRIDSLSRKKIRDRAREVLLSVGLDSKINVKTKDLSGGQQQRVAIARAIMSDSEIILADEPTGALDTETGQIIMDLLTKLNKAGKTIILVTHDLNIANRCKKIIKMKDGKIESYDLLNDNVV